MTPSDLDESKETDSANDARTAEVPKWDESPTA
jgi:hypothetical protein